MKLRCRNGHTWRTERMAPQPWERPCPECGAPAEGSLRRSTRGLGGVGAREPRPLVEAHERFTRLVCEWPCWLRRRPSHRCWGRKDPHHLVPAEFVRRHYGDLPAVELADILYEPLLGAPLCRRGHEAVEARSELIYRHELDPELIEWCRRIEAIHPGRASLLERLRLECPDSAEAKGAPR